MNLLTNYFRVAYRNVRRRTGSALINGIGLTVGFAVAILIGVWTSHELSYDAFHADAERMYRVVMHSEIPEGSYTMRYVPAPLGPKAASEHAAVERAVRVQQSGSRSVIRVGTQTFTGDDVLTADPGFFDLFTFPRRSGSAASPLAEPGSIVLTSAAAEKYFGTSDAVGRGLSVNGRDYEVTGVTTAIPVKSHLQFSAVTSSVDARWERSTNWKTNPIVTYVKLTEPGARATVASTFTDWVSSRKDRSGDAGSYEMLLQPITDVHLGEGIPHAIGSAGSWTYVFFFGVLGAFVLCVAGINFVNLATARASERASEVGMRKSLGATRAQLMKQFLGESLLLSTAAFVVGIGVAAAVLPAVETVVGTDLALAELLRPPVAGALLASLLAVGLGAGLYPALVLSRYEPANVLKESGAGGSRGSTLRRVLVVFQFAVSILLIVGTGVVHDQLGFLEEKDLGFAEEGVVIVENASKLPPERRRALLREIRALPEVREASLAYSAPSQNFLTTIYRTVGSGESRERQLSYTFGDAAYASALDLSVDRGRFFEPGRADDQAVVLNEAAARALFGNEDPIGQRITWADGGPVDFTVKGVVENIHFQSLHQEIRPMAIFSLLDHRARQIIVRMNAGDLQTGVQQVKVTWEQMAGGFPLSISFMDDILNAQYRTEQRLASVSTFFSAIAILIACLGLLGLAAYTVAARRKEIGVRKAIGASVQSIVLLISRQFLILVGCGMAVAVPIAYVLASQWLEGFAYRTEVSLSMIAAVCVGALVIAQATIGIEVSRAARTAPSTVLRSE